MAMADYYHCDKCGAKAFYDAQLCYDFDTPSDSNGSGFKLQFVGDMAVICEKCAETHEVIIKPKEKP